MVNFFLFNGATKRLCTALTAKGAAEIMSLFTPNSKGYVVEDNKIAFAQNMTVEEAAISHGLTLPMQSMVVLPVAPAVLPKGHKNRNVFKLRAMAASNKKPVKAKKTTLKSKVVVKNKKKVVVKKTIVKSKVKPKTKPKVKVKKRATKKKGR